MKRVGLVLISLSITACGPLNDMKDMKNTTNELLKVSKDMNEKMNSMNTSTQTMGQTTGKMAGKMDETVAEMKAMRKDLMGMANEMKDMHGDIKSMNVDMKDMSNDAVLGLSTILINESFKHLVEHKDTFGAKLVAAGEYASAYAFQFLKNNNTEINAYRADLYTSGLNMFFGHVKSLLYDGIASEGPYQEDESPTFDRGNQLANAYAIAFRMSEINPNQKKANRVNGMELQSILSVIKEGINVHMAESKSGLALAQKPEWVSGPIQNNLEVIKTLLQLRYNIFMLKAIAMVSDLGDVTATGLMAQGKWVVKYSKSTENIGILKRTNLMVLAALDAGVTLSKLGGKVIDIKLKKIIPASVIIKNMNVTKPTAIPKGMEEEVAKLELSLKKLQDSYLNL